MPRMLLGVVIISALLTPIFADDAKVPLKTEIPEEMLVGTPPDVLAMLYDFLEKPPTEAPKLLVPKGTVNLALKKKVTSTDSRPIIGDLKFITDGAKAGTEDTYVEISPGHQWVQIDLGQPSRIHAVYMWHFFREARSYFDIVIQVADDEKFTKNVKTVYNTDVDNTLKFGIGKDRSYIETYLGKLVDTKGIKGQYVRIHSNGNTLNDLNHYVEIEVFGQPIKAQK